MIRNLRSALAEAAEQIEDNAALFKSGRPSAYQAVAIQLRKLLTDQEALLPRVFPGPTLHRLRDENLLVRDLPDSAEGTRRFAIIGADPRGTLKLVVGGPAVLLHALDVQTDAPKMPVDEWVRQWILRPDIEIRQLIRQTASKEAAHTDESIGKAVETANELLALSGGRQLETHRAVIVGIGDYIAGRVWDLWKESVGP